MSTATKKRTRPLQIDWSAINRGMDRRTRDEFNRLHGRLSELASDVEYELSFAEMDGRPVREGTSGRMRKLVELLAGIPWLYP